MKRALLALALLMLPSVALAAPQTITIFWDVNVPGWVVLSADPPVLNQNGQAVSGYLAQLGQRVADGLLTLQRTDGKKYQCNAKAFFLVTFCQSYQAIGVSSLNAKSCVALN